MRHDRPQQSEHQIQATLIRWVALMRAQHPELDLLYAIPNGGHRHPATAARLKAEGVKAGVPDLCLPVPREPHHGLYLEMKTVRGRTSKAQQRWLTALGKHGYRVAVCRGWVSAAREICEYLGIEADF